VKESTVFSLHAAQILTESRSADLRGEARAARLAAAVTRCCRTSAAARARHRAIDVRDRLGAAVGRNRAAVVCCAAA
jgi:hypothetical protein